MGDTYPRTAVGLDARNRPNEIETIPALVRELRRSGISCEVLYLHAADEVLLKRYAETRRKHPLVSGEVSLREAIASERKLLEPITTAADLVIDTSNMGVHALREMIRERIDRRREGRLSLMFESFGYKLEARHVGPAHADAGQCPQEHAAGEVMGVECKEEVGRCRPEGSADEDDPGVHPVGEYAEYDPGGYVAELVDREDHAGLGIAHAPLLPQQGQDSRVVDEHQHYEQLADAHQNEPAGVVVDALGLPAGPG